MDSVLDSCRSGATERWSGQSGFTLVEVLIANLLGLILVAALAGCFAALDSAGRNQIEHQNLMLAADAARRTLAASIRQAGQNRQGVYLGVPQPSEIWIDSDLTGSVGDPDGALAHSFERQRYRMNPDATSLAIGTDFDRTGNLQWKSGSGSFQPFISHFGAATFLPRPDAAEPEIVQAKLVARGAYFVGNRTQVPVRSFRFDWSVEKTREQWFRYDLSPQ